MYQADCKQTFLVQMMRPTSNVPLFQRLDVCFHFTAESPANFASKGTFDRDAAAAILTFSADS